MTKAYIYAEFDVTDTGKWAIYVPLAQASMQAFGARPLVSSELEVLEGDVGRRRISILEFDSAETARCWYRSPPYQEAIRAREGAAELTALLLFGV